MNDSNRSHESRNTISCRFCRNTLQHSFVNLGMTPLCQTQIAPEHLNHYEPYYPLHAYVCDSCFLVQLDEYVAPDRIFSDEYPYFSSYSDSWVEHARQYCMHMQQRHGISERSFVVELASNDGYLLQHFVAAGIRVLGIEPTANTAAAAREKGIDTEVAFFGTGTAERIRDEYQAADLLVGNNVLAHVPDLRDFVQGIQRLLAPSGIVTMEFPHLLNLIEQNQFDTIYHEHFSYLSFLAVQKVFAHFGLTLFDVEEIPTHGGSLRIYGRHENNEALAVADSVARMLEKERAFGLDALPAYEAFQERVYATKRDILQCLIEIKNAGKSVCGYGAPGKGNTLLNFCGIGTDLLDFTVDRNPHKAGTYTPGSRIPILSPDVIRERRPDYVFILPWNLKDEIMAQTSFISEWGGRWIAPIPKVEILG